MKLPYQFSFPEDVDTNVRYTIQEAWRQIAQAHNAAVQPRYVEDLGNPPTVPPEMEQYELIFLSCPNWGAGVRYLVYFDGVVRHYFAVSGADLI